MQLLPMMKEKRIVLVFCIRCAVLRDVDSGANFPPDSGLQASGRITFSEVESVEATSSRSSLDGIFHTSAPS